MTVTEQLGAASSNYYATRIHHAQRTIRGDVIVHRRGGGPLPAHSSATCAVTSTRPAAPCHDATSSICVPTSQAHASKRPTREPNPAITGDPYIDQMRHDVEREIVQLVAELDRRNTIPPPPPAPPPTPGLSL